MTSGIFKAAILVIAALTFGSGAVAALEPQIRDGGIV